MSPGGIRIGTPALTTRGFKENDFIKVGEYLHEVIELGIEIQKESGKKLIDFKKKIQEPLYLRKIDTIKKDINSFAETFNFINN